MKSRIVTLAALVFLMAGAALAAQAQRPATLILQVEVPFPFVVNDQTMPAGPYVIRMEEGQPARRVISIVHQNGEGVQPMLVPVESIENGDRGARESQEPMLIFNSYGDKHYLSQIWGAGAMTGFLVPPSSQEKELAEQQQMKPEKTEVPCVVKK